MSANSIFSNIVTGVKGFFNNPDYTDQAHLKSEDGIMKAYIPNFLYKPPYGYPRLIDVPSLRKLAVSPYVFMVTSTIIDEVCSVEWDIVPKAKDEPTEATTEDEIEKEQIRKPKGVDPKTLAQIKEVKNFFYNPNGNEESFEFILRSTLRDILELDSGVIIKVFNRAGKMVQLFSRDGGTFLKNPDVYGYLGDRAEYIEPAGDLPTEKVQSYYDTVLRHNAAYFQYGWTAGAMPVPFGRRELVWLSRNPRSDSIYGRSPVEVLQDIIMSLVYGATFNLDFYTNNNMPDGIISLLGSNSEQISKFRERFEKQFKTKDTYGNWRKQFHKYPITNADVKFTPFQLTAQQLEIISQQEWFSKIVWACFGVTPSELGYTENSNRATEMVQSRVFKRKAVKPLLKLMEYHINSQIMPEFEYDDIEFKFVEYDLNEDIEKHKLYETQLKNGIRSVNEIREEIGLEPIEGGDKYTGAIQDNEWDEASQFDDNEEYEVRESLGLDEKSVETKHKYIKRTGTAGKYKYWYRDSSGKLYSHGKKKDNSNGKNWSMEQLNKYVEEKLKEIPPKKIEKLTKNVKQFKEGDDTLAKYNKDKKWSALRDVTHKKIFKEYTKNAKQAKAKDEPRIIFMAGMPASGKTYATKEQFTKINDYLVQDKNGDKFLVLNTDDIKTHLPEYDNGDGAVLVHEESSSILKSMLKAFGQRKVNIILDGTMANLGSAKKKLKIFQQHDYKTEIIHIDVTTKISIDRAMDRYKKSKRYVPLNILPKYGETLPKTLNTIKTKVDKFTWIDNNSTKPKIIEEISNER